MENNESIAINALQHYAFCKRQWSLVYLDGLWADNYKTVEGNIVHELVDDPFFNESRKGVRISRSVPVYLDDLPIHGICDYIEFKADKITIVEYKNGEPKQKNTVNYHDAIQLAAQMMCVNHMFDSTCEGYIYYNKIKRRVRLNDEQQYFSDVKKITAEIKEALSKKMLLKKEAKQSCRNCSMIKDCMPKIDVKISAKDRINKIWEAEI